MMQRLLFALIPALLLVPLDAVGQVTLTFKGRIDSASFPPDALRQFSTWTAQLDGDASLEVVTKDGSDLVILDGNTLVEEARSDPNSNQWGSSDAIGTVLVYDFDGDGLLEIVAQIVPPNAYGQRFWFVWDTGATDTSGVLSGESHDFASRLGISVPEPTLSQCKIRLALESRGSVSVRIVDVSGRLVQTLLDEIELTEGDHEVEWDGKDRRGHDAPSGVYYVQLATRKATDSRRITLVR